MAEERMVKHIFFIGCSTLFVTCFVLFSLGGDLILFKPAAMDSLSPSKPEPKNKYSEKEFVIGNFRSREEENKEKVRVQTAYRNSLDRQKMINTQVLENTYFIPGDFQIGMDEKKVTEKKKHEAHEFYKVNDEDIRVRDTIRFLLLP